MRSTFPTVCLVLSFVFIATPAPASSASTSEFLAPSEHELVWGTVDLAARVATPPRGFVQFVEFYEQQPGGLVLIGHDFEPRADAMGPDCEGGCYVAEWEATWTIPHSHPTGPSDLVALATICDPSFGCKQQSVASVGVFVDPDPPIVVIASPTPHQKAPLIVPLYATTTAADVANVAWSWMPAAFPLNKGVPNLDQHVVGADTARPGTVCGLTAAAASLRWFDDHGEPGMVADGKSDKDVVNELAGLSNDAGTGTSPAALTNALNDYLKARGLGDSWEAKNSGHPPTVKEIEDEHQQGQDVVLVLKGTKQDGSEWRHAVTLDGVHDHGDGTTGLDVMDPWDGQSREVNSDANGAGTYENPFDGGKANNVKIVRMIHVSPKTGSFSPTMPGALYNSGGTWFGAWSVATMPQGNYVLRAAATDSWGHTLMDYQIVNTDP